MYEDQNSVLGRAVFEEKPLPISDRDAKLEQLNTQMAEITNIIDTLENSGIDAEAREDITEINELLGDDELETEAQTITGAINELKSSETDPVTINDTLTSTSATEALSAKQGKILKDDLDAHKADNVTDNDGAHGLKVESGTFTPTIIGLTTAGDNTYSPNKGFYEKIGRTVFFHILIIMTAKDPAMEGSVHIAGLPFVAYAQSGRHSSVSIASYSNIVTAGKQLGGYVQDNRTTIGIHLSGDNITALPLSASGISNNTVIRVSGIYQTA